MSQRDISKRIQGLGKTLATQQFQNAPDIHAQLDRAERLMPLSLGRNGSLKLDAREPLTEDVIYQPHLNLNS
jgi:hypothetical protein